MEITTYAPVVITTLNRFEHFKRCLESLERCTGAEHTDVYVGLDYPPSEKYVEGWKKIDSYLKEKEAKNGFGHLFVRRRDHNCGVGKSGSNGGLLVKEVVDVADRFISTEDDNEFSPCFLEYMNKALEKYEDDERVVCVCGYSPFDVEGKGNIYFSRQMYAWGIARWVKKSRLISKSRNLESMNNVLKDFKSAMRLYNFRPVILSRVMDQVIKGKRYGDVSYTCYCVQNNRFCVYPSQSLVRNWGRDGSGVHSKKIKEDIYTNHVISVNTSFDLDEVEVYERKDISSEMRGISSKSWYGNMTILLRYVIWRITGKDCFSIRRFL